MSADLLARLSGLAFSFVAGAALLLLLAEGWRPLTELRHPLARRWLANLCLYLLVATVQYLLAPSALVGAAFIARERGWGLLNGIELDGSGLVVLGAAASVLAVDLAGYWVHRLEHRSAALWRIHRLHHSDPDVDVTTSYRFHPFEVLLRLVVQGAVVMITGIAPLAVAGYVIFSSVTSVLSHANLRLPRALNRLVGLVALTPEMHRTHHSIEAEDSSSNFGVCFSFWDPLFGTYRSGPVMGHQRIVFGVAGRSTRDATSLVRMLADPFVPERPLPLTGRPAGDLVEKLPL